MRSYFLLLLDIKSQVIMLYIKLFYLITHSMLITLGEFLIILGNFFAHLLLTI